MNLCPSRSLNSALTGLWIFAINCYAETPQFPTEKGIDRPSAEAFAEFNIPTTNQRIVVNKAQADPDQNPNLYFYTPPLALKTRGQGDFEKGLPQNPDKAKVPSFLLSLNVGELSTSAKMGFLIESLGIKQLATDEIWKLTESNKIVVKRWPIKKLIVDIVSDIGESDIIATGESGNLQGAAEYAYVTFSFTNENFQRFLALVESQSVHFECSYTFDATQVEVNSSEFQLNAFVKGQIKENTTQAQREGAPVFMKQWRAMKEKLSSALKLQVRAHSRDYKMQLTSEHLSSLLTNFISEGLSTLAINERPDIIKDAREYLKPLIEPTKTTVEQSGTNKATNETVYSSDVGAGLKAKIPLPGLDLGFDFGAKDTDYKKKTIETEYGIKISFDKETSKYYVENVDVYYLKNLESIKDFTASELQVVALGKREVLREASRFGPDFTVEELKEKMKLQRISSSYDGVPLGTMLPFWGEFPPEGWVWADGKSIWPDENWVPKGSRNKPVVDLSGGLLVGGWKEGWEQGKVWRSGKVKVPSLDVSIDNLRTQPLAVNFPHSISETKDIFFVKILNKFARGSFLEFYQQNGYGAGNVYMESGTSQSITQYTNVAIDSNSIAKANSAILGSAATVKDEIALESEDSAPPFLSCKWIIRLY